MWKLAHMLGYLIDYIYDPQRNFNDLLYKVVTCLWLASVNVYFFLFNPIKIFKDGKICSSPYIQPEKVNFKELHSKLLSHFTVESRYQLLVVAYSIFAPSNQRVVIASFGFVYLGL